MSNATNTSMLNPVHLGFPFHFNTTDPSVQRLEQYLLCVWSSEGMNPDMQGYAVRLSNLVVNVCLVILIRYSNESVAESVSVLLLQVYTLLICAFISLSRKTLSSADAHFAITSTVSPLAVYLIGASLRRIFNRRSHLFRRLGPNNTLIYAILSLLLLPMWITMDILIYSARLFTNSEQCPHLDFYSWFMYRFADATLTFGVFDVWMLAPVIAFVWVVYALRHFRDVRWEYRTLKAGSERWQSFRWIQWFTLWAECFAKAQWHVITQSHPWLVTFFITVAYLIWSSCLVLYETHLSLFYYNMAASIQPYVIGASPLKPYQSLNHDGLDFGQLLAAAVAFPPLWRVLSLMWASRRGILSWIKGYPRSTWNGIVFLFTGHRNPWEQVLNDRRASNMDSGFSSQSGSEKGKGNSPSNEGNFIFEDLVNSRGEYTGYSERELYDPDGVPSEKSKMARYISQIEHSTRALNLMASNSDTEAVLALLLEKVQSMQTKLDLLCPSSPTPSESKSLPMLSETGRLPSVDSTIGIGSTPTKDPAPGRADKLYPGRVLLTTYPDQHGISPFTLSWGASTASQRGPVICSRMLGTIKYRNAIGAHSGSYSIYRALSIAMGSLDPTYKPDYSMTQPPVDIPPNPAWTHKEGEKLKIVSLDPWGHLVPSVFENEIKDKEQGGLGLDVRPSISVTKAHIKLKEIDDSVSRGELIVDGKIVLQSEPLKMEDGSLVPGLEPGVEVNVSKAAVDPVWYLPGVAERFGISESLLRRALFEDTGGMYPELITRPDIKVFLPPIGGLTVYIFGNPASIRDPSKLLTLRVHDECNGSDVFGSDICTCKPYLVYAMEECIRTAQGRHPDQMKDGRPGEPGVGIVVYFRKEGRALGEVTKYLVYNLRKRGGDSADRYFKSTELVAGVKDMRFQASFSSSALMPDVLHWLGITKIDNMVSMSDMKYDAIVGSGIPIRKRYDIPAHLIPPDSQVEIDAKIASGYFSSGKQITQEDLKNTVGRSWEEVEH
ncbi:hypothetical protein D9757_008960 [Collybiopsis confluens]|uniref:GTP cyclohydrolase II n=1 Tax=Collybiopsis confluens TaxID=2823264 RepID=A0A8H5HF85_9AGAR|nr:hypothetical protein D9757_008960 [Collybiopsis confluens]